MKVNSINGTPIEKWIKENSVDKVTLIDISKFDEETIQTAINLGLLTYQTQ